jgi:hypothetical protein
MTEHDELGDSTAGDREWRDDPHRPATGGDAERRRKHLADASADQQRRERREQRDVVRMEDPARVAERDGCRSERAADGDQPWRPLIGTAQAREREDRDPRHEREAEQPSRLVTEPGLEEAKRPGRASEQ